MVLAAAAGFLVYAGQVAGLRNMGDGYTLTADFRSVEGIAIGSDVRLAGISVGSVTALALDPGTYRAEARFRLRDGLELPEDSDVKIVSEGLLGDAFLEITPGKSQFMLADGDAILNTRGPATLFELLTRLGSSRE